MALVGLHGEGIAADPSGPRFWFDFGALAAVRRCRARLRRRPRPGVATVRLAAKSQLVVYVLLTPLVTPCHNKDMSKLTDERLAEIRERAAFPVVNGEDYQEDIDRRDLLAHIDHLNEQPVEIQGLISAAQQGGRWTVQTGRSADSAIPMDPERGVFIVDELGNQWVVRRARAVRDIPTRLEVLLVPGSGENGHSDISVRAQTANRVLLEAVGW